MGIQIRDDFCVFEKCEFFNVTMRLCSSGLTNEFVKFTLKRMGITNKKVEYKGNMMEKRAKHAKIGISHGDNNMIWGLHGAYKYGIRA